ncbi:MAG: PQQ-binding-like beta-propeller repeat protein [Planctomycetales bacterium]|nr:PQQ-binding-like beta-propeller repeat protein [Planctomycetales bacterium]
MRFVMCAALCLWFGTSALADSQWSRFRGPNGCGTVDDVGKFPVAWTDADYAWRVELQGVGHSSPVAWDDLVVVTSGDAESGELIVDALDLASGKSLWSRRLPGVDYPKHEANSLASSTPALDSQRIYVTRMTDQGVVLAALSHQGVPLWEKLIGPYGERHGYGVSPIVVDDCIVLMHDSEAESFAICLDAANGNQRWKAPRKSGTASFSTPLVWRDSHGSQQIIAQSSAEGLAGLSFTDGSVQWNAPTAFPQRCVGSPIADSQRVFAGNGAGSNGHSYVCVTPPTAKGEEAVVAYTLRRGMPQVPTALLHGERLLVWHDRGTASYVAVEDGKTVWQQRLSGHFYGSPVSVGDVAYCISEEGVVVALALDDEFKELGQTDLGAASHATPAIHRGRMLLRTVSTVMCLPEEPATSP